MKEMVYRVIEFTFMMKRFRPQRRESAAIMYNDIDAFKFYIQRPEIAEQPPS